LQVVVAALVVVAVAGVEVVAAGVVVVAAGVGVVVVTVAGVVASPEADVPAYLVAAQVAAGGEAARDKLDGDHSHQSGNKGGGPRLADKVRGDTASLQKGK